MKKLLLILFCISILSCQNDDVQLDLDIYNEWRWEQTCVGDCSEGGYRTSENLDTTYYWNFQRDGVLLIKDIKKDVKAQGHFEKAPENGLYINDFLYSYTIQGDKLTISNIYGVVAWTDEFRLAKIRVPRGL